MCRCIWAGWAVRQTKSPSAFMDATKSQRNKSVQISLVLDIIISALLVLTIAYAMRLNQRLSQLRSDKNELLQLVKTFAEATSRAEAGIKNLKIHSESLHAEVNKAKALKDDLSYLVERGGRAA